MASNAQDIETLHSFQGFDGSSPQSVLVQARNGILYGTTRFTGASGDGTIFKITTNGQLTTIYGFEGTNDGRNPQCGLFKASDGNLYGTTVGGDAGTPVGPTFFKITSTDEFVAMARFATNGQSVFAPFVEGPGGLYSVSSSAGAFNWGTVFSMDFNGALTGLGTFSLTNGSQPQSALLYARDGNLYGTTRDGGNLASPAFGTVFRLGTNGGLETLIRFNGTNGRRPMSGILQTSGGQLYGTTSGGGSNNLGTVFEMDSNGWLRTVVTFNGANGASPQGDLIQALDGNIYGVTTVGGVDNLGTVFRLQADDSFEVLHSFNRTNGASPFAGLMQAADGKLYGTTRGGGSADWGTIYRFSLVSNAHGVTLTIRRTANEIVLSWPTNAPAFGVQWTTNLTLPVSWTDTTSKPATLDNTLVLTNAIEEPARFYRLKNRSAVSKADS